MHGIYKITVMFQVITRRHYLGHRLPPGARQCSEFICSNVVVYDLWLLSTCSNLWLVSWLTCHKQSSMRQKHRHLKVSCKRLVYTGCPRRNVPDFGRVFLMLKYTDITQNTYVQSWTVTEIMARKFWNFDSCYTLIDYQIHIKTGRKCGFCNVNTCT